MYAAILYTAILITIATCAHHNAEKLKYPELNKFHVPAKLTKLKLIKHFAHVALVTLKYSQSTDTWEESHNSKFT